MRAFAFAILLLLGLTPLAARADVASDAAFVAAAYQTLLGRPVDTPGLQAFGNAPSRQQVVATIIGSPEYRTREVAALYQALLHRPTDGGANAFVTQLTSGSPLSLEPDTQVAATLMGSPEYFVRNGSANPSFVTAVYHDLLHRTASPPEVTAQLQVLTQLNANSATPDAARKQFASYVLGSPEGKQSLIGLLLPAVSPASGANLVVIACAKLQCSGGGAISSGPVVTVPLSVQLPPSGRTRSATLSIGDFKITIQQIESHAGPAPKITLTATYDKASAQFLMKTASSGEHIGTAKLYINGGGTYTMHDVLVSGFALSGNKADPTETISLNFTKIEWTK